MKIQPVENAVSMKMKYNRKIYDATNVSRRVKDYISLDNGKDIVITTTYYRDKPTSKLLYLKDELGRWVRSKLVFYDYKGKRSLVKTSRRIEDYLNNE